MKSRERRLVGSVGKKVTTRSSVLFGKRRTFKGTTLVKNPQM